MKRDRSFFENPFERRVRRKIMTSIFEKKREKRQIDETRTLFEEIVRTKRRKLLYGYKTIDDPIIQMKMYIKTHQSQREQEKFLPCDQYFRWCVLQRYKVVNSILAQAHRERDLRKNIMRDNEIKICSYDDDCKRICEDMYNSDDEW